MGAVKIITSISFNNFKALEKYVVHLKHVNILVGPNNSGKSSILDALRILQGALRYASKYKPVVIKLPDNKVTYGYIIPKSSIPIAIEHIHSNYNDEPTVLTYKIEGGKKLVIIFNKHNQTLFYGEALGCIPKTASAFRIEFPIRLNIVPTLGPLENDEELHSFEYVERWKSSHRAPRLFRSFWYYNRESFECFKQMVENTWPGMSISPPEFDSTSLNMFCLESRIPREVSWAGYGFQIWLQLLTHIINADKSDIIVVDEPEIYLHPDLQRKILDLLKGLGPKVILATHSVEIINEAEPDDVLLVDKNESSTKRLSNLKGLQTAVELLGSGQNVHLTRLAKSKKILFVEGKDQKFLTRLTALAGYPDLLSSGVITIIPIGGFSQWERIAHAQWAFSGVLGEQIDVCALFDRDYRCVDEVSDFYQRLASKVSLLHILERKEIENYLLIPTALESAIKRQLKSRVEKSSIEQTADFDIVEIITMITEHFKDQVFGQMLANKYRFYHSKGQDLASLTQLKEFEDLWSDLNLRLKIVPGKLVLSSLNEHLQQTFGISITTSLIMSCMKVQDIGEDLKMFFSALENFRNGTMPRDNTM